MCSGWHWTDASLLSAGKVPHPDQKGVDGKPQQPDWAAYIAEVEPPKHGQGPPQPRGNPRATGGASAANTTAAQMDRCVLSAVLFPRDGCAFLS